MSELVRYRFSVEEYHLMAEAGLFGEDDRVELLDGEVVEMAPIGNRHAAAVNWFTAWLTTRLGNRATIGVQNPIRLSERSEPQPDLAALRTRSDYDASARPTPDDVLWLIEVADTTMGSDRGAKVPLYAAAGIREVWLVDLPTRRLQCLRQPSPDGYQEVVTVEAGDVVSPLAFPDVTLVVAELFGALSI